MNVSPEWAAQEFLRRKRARASLIEYSQAIEIPGVPSMDFDDEEAPILYNDAGKPIGGGQLIHRFEKDPVIYSPVDARIAVHHKLMMLKIQKCIETPRGRQIILAPPGSAKSTYASVVGSSWAMGRKRNVQVILASYATGIAAKQSRKVRAVVRDPRYSSIWDGNPRLMDDQRAIDDWSLSNGSSLMAAGMLAGITGNRCDLLVIDDPTANREQADSLTIREKIYSEYIDTAMTRAKPWMSVILIMCMVGSTKVRMANGSTKQLRDICKGDLLATYDNGKLASARVLNWKNQGVDGVFELRTQGGATTRANARHPFLVERNGVREWIRLKYIKTGDTMVRLHAAPIATTVEQQPKTDALLATANGGERMEYDTPHKIPARIERQELSTGTGLPKRNTKIFSQFKKVFARYAGFLQRLTSARTGVESCVLTTTTPPVAYADSYATTATSWSVTERRTPYYVQACGTSQFTNDDTNRVVSVIPCLPEEVFDIQVERTENFIADGFVSHNTRWHEDDLVGAILPEHYEGESGIIKCRDGQTWDVLCIPAEAERDDDILGRKIGDFLWPEFWPKEHWSTWRDNPRAARTWAALFQQRPAPYGGIHFNREMFQYYNPDLPRSDY